MNFILCLCWWADFSIWVQHYFTLMARQEMIKCLVSFPNYLALRTIEDCDYLHRDRGPLGCWSSALVLILNWPNKQTKNGNRKKQAKRKKHRVSLTGDCRTQSFVMEVHANIWVDIKPFCYLFTLCITILFILFLFNVSIALLFQSVYTNTCIRIIDLHLFDLFVSFVWGNSCNSLNLSDVRQYWHILQCCYW